MIKQSIRSLSLGLATIATLSVLLANNVEAAPISTTQPPTDGRAACDVSDVQITEIKSQALGSAAMDYPYPISANGCLGAFNGNDIVTVGDNRGFLGDGMLNNTDMFPDSGAFLTPEDLLDLQGLGTKQDPGWIFVGKIDYEATGTKYTNGTVTDGIGSYTFDISNILTLIFSDSDMRSGTFTYKPPVTNPDALLDILGANKFFDQAAVVLKAGDQWAMYNFKISDLQLPPVIGTEEINFMFSGTFSLPGTFVNNGGKTPGLSHVSFWLRDPYGATTSTVPTPGTLLSLLLGLGLMVARRKYRTTNK